VLSARRDIGIRTRQKNCGCVPPSIVAASSISTNIEDGVALGDQSLREALAVSYPAAWKRI
jgi:hypothetical protein